MNCTECKEKLVEYIEQLLTESQRQTAEAHLDACPQCRAQLQELTKLRLRITSNSRSWQATNLENAVLNRILREQNLKLKHADNVSRQLLVWRKFMKSKFTKLAAAAVIIVAVALSLTFFEKSIPTASAAEILEQTIAANHSVRYLHFKDFKSGQNEPKEFWFECDESGQIKNARWYMPEWDSPEDGAKVVVWKAGKAQVWFKKQKGLVTVGDTRVINQFNAFLQTIDPKMAIEILYQQQKESKVQLELKEPSDRSHPIVVTATYGKNSRRIFYIDQATKLVTSIETYLLNGEKYEYLGVMEFYDYNQPIDPKMFDLESEVPADVMKVDQTTQEIGLLQGQMTNDEIAVEVVRQFFESLIAKDYGKAGKLIQGIPADRMQQAFGKIKFLRIISIGKPARHPNPATKGVVVPTTVEIEKDGKISELNYDRLGVREVYNQPDKRAIFTGIDLDTPEGSTKTDEQNKPQIKENNKVLNDVEKEMQVAVKETARLLFQACADENWGQFLKHFRSVTLTQNMKNYLGGLEVITLGDPSKSDDSGSWIVHYKIKMKSGEIRDRDLRINFDNAAKQYLVVGGL